MNGVNGVTYRRRTSSGEVRTYWRPVLARLTCGICGLDVYKAGHHPYMLNDDVWLAANNGKVDGCLCIPCAELQLGRLLTHDDFKPALICNDPHWAATHGMASILIDRLTSNETAP